MPFLFGGPARPYGRWGQRTVRYSATDTPATPNRTPPVGQRGQPGVGRGGAAKVSRPTRRWARTSFSYRRRL